MALPFLENFLDQRNGFGFLGKTVPAVRAANQVAMLSQGAGALATAGVEGKGVAAQRAAVKVRRLHTK